MSNNTLKKLFAGDNSFVFSLIEKPDLAFVERMDQNNLYNCDLTDGMSSYFKYRFDLWIKNKGVPDNFKFLLVEDQNSNPVGVLMMEFFPEEKYDMFILEDQFNPKSRIKYKIDKKLSLQVSIGVFVKREYRGLGIGGKLVKDAESVILKNIKVGGDEIPAVIAHQKAYDLYNKNCMLSYPFSYTPPYANLNLEIQNLTYRYVFSVLDDRVPFHQDKLKTYFIFDQNNNVVRGGLVEGRIVKNKVR